MTQQWIPTAYRENRLYNSSLALLEGRGVRQNEAAAFALNAEAADLGHRDAVLAMGWFYLNGVGVEKDRDRSWHWYRKSARHGDPRAMFSLGYLSYLERDYAEARTWFSRAIELDHNRSLYWMAKLLWKGYGVEEDRKRARSPSKRQPNPMWWKRSELLDLCLAVGANKLLHATALRNAAREQWRWATKKGTIRCPGT